MGEEKRWRSRATRTKAPDRYAELARLVGEVLLDARPWEHDDADRQDFQDLVVALEGCGLGMTGPVGLERNVRDLAGVGPAGGDALGAGRRAAMQQDHAGMVRADLVERAPD